MSAILRLLIIVGLLVGVIWGGMLALVTYVDVQPREMTQTLPVGRLNK